MISSSRSDTQATNLQGIWNEELSPPWSSNYTVNINTQMNYWPVHCSNLTECFEPFVSLVLKIRESGKRTAKNYYNAKGFVSHHNVDLWAHTTPVGNKTANSYFYSVWNMSSGWLCCQLFDAYEYTEDIQMLNDIIYPTIKEAVEFYIDILRKNKNNRLVLIPDTSPENTFVINNVIIAIDQGTTMSLSILHELFDRCIRCGEILQTDHEFITKVKTISDSIEKIRINSDGRLAEWAEEYKEHDIHHRHLGHLYSLYPGTLISVETTPQLAEACKNSLNTRGDDGTGWSTGWKICLWASLKDGNRALELIKKQLHYVESSKGKISLAGGGTYANMLDAHPPFQIDGNFAAVAGICHMLLQNSNAEIVLLPALPDIWINGSIFGIKTKGNITVDIEWKNGKLNRAFFCSLKQKQIRIKYNNQPKTITLKPNGDKFSADVNGDSFI